MMTMLTASSPGHGSSIQLGDQPTFLCVGDGKTARQWKKKRAGVSRVVRHFPLAKHDTAPDVARLWSLSGIPQSSRWVGVSVCGGMVSKCV
jgi:hypothetical protein